MSILHRSAYLTLSALLAIVPAACGGDDDDDGNNNTPDAANNGGDIDAAPVGDIDAAPVGDIDAAPVVGDQFLLGLDVVASALGMDLPGVSRLIATVNLTSASTADITL